jgi:hypothetical protein
VALPKGTAVPESYEETSSKGIKVAEEGSYIEWQQIVKTCQRFSDGQGILIESSSWLC